MKQASVKKKMAVLAGAALMLVSGMGQAAHAFNFDQQDLILAIYGNEKEVLVNLTDLDPVGPTGPGNSMNTLTGSSTVYEFNLAPYLNAAGVLPGSIVGGLTNPLRYTVMGFQQDLDTFETIYKAGSSNDAATLGVQTSSTLYVSRLDLWRGNVTDANTPNVDANNVALVDRLTGNSFTGRMGIGDTLNAGFNTAMASNLGQLLNIVMGDPFATSIPVSPMGQALLSANGLFQVTGGQIAPIPLPAAAVLFGTGIIGLVGIARRKLFGQTGQA
jgi:hypothetical protein